MAFEEGELEEDQQAGGDGDGEGQAEGIPRSGTRPGDAVEAEQGIDEAEEQPKQNGYQESALRTEVERDGGTPDELAEQSSSEGDQGIDHEPREEARGKSRKGTPEEGCLTDRAVAQFGQQGYRRPENDVDIGQQVAIAHVELVEAQLGGQHRLEVLLHRVTTIQHLLLATVKDGGRGSDAGTHGEDQLLQFGGPLGGDVGILRARTDQRHLTDQHIPQLRQLIELGITQELAEGGDAAIAIGGDFGAVVGFVVLIHRAEFEDAKGLATPPGSRTAIEDRTWGVLFELDGDIEKERTEEEQAEDRDEDVDGSANSVLKMALDTSAFGYKTCVVGFGHVYLVSGFGVSGFHFN